MNNGSTNPSNLRSEAQSILSELPLTYIGTHGSRDDLLDGVRRVHREIAEAFGEPRPHNIGVASASEDLTRWVNLWTWHPHAAQWVAQLRHLNHIAAGFDDSDLRWVAKKDAVCPECLNTGHLEYQEASWDHRCPRTGTSWTWKSYRAAVKSAAENFRGAA